MLAQWFFFIAIFRATFVLEGCFWILVSGSLRLPRVHRASALLTARVHRGPGPRKS